MQRPEEIPDGKAGEFRGALKAKTLRGILSQALNQCILGSLKVQRLSARRLKLL